MAGRRRIAVLGGGAWGTALANLAARNAGSVVLWARDAGQVAEMAATGVNARRLPGIPLLSNVEPTTAASDLADAELVLAVVPAQTIRAVLALLAPRLAAGVPLVICAKGIEHGTRMFLSEVATAVLPGRPIGVLSGPSFARDVARESPTAVTLAMPDLALAADLAGALGAPWFRLYHSADVRGVEIGGAAKNVLAIASGIAAGRRLGASAGAALLARGFAELARFGAAYGADPATLMGLSGLGDLALTCASPESRNFSYGFDLGSRAAAAAAGPRGALVEGVHTCSALVEMAQAKGIEMPIAAAVDAVLTGRLTVDDAIDALLARPSRAETRALLDAD